MIDKEERDKTQAADKQSTSSLDRKSRDTRFNSLDRFVTALRSQNTIKMSDMKTLNLTSLVTKKTRRAKARLMQNFGKADKTTDEIFEVYQINFNRQQSCALNLQKHVKNYVHCLEQLHEASKGLSQCLLDMHEKEWPKHDTLENNAYELDHINEDLDEKLKESVLAPLEQYLKQFSEMREKIAKRGRKLVDYDSQRHTFEALQQHQSGKQGDDSKLSKSRDQLEEARRVYESLNSDLHEELPTLYDNRLPFVITVFQRLFASHITYHTDHLNIQKSYLETVEQLNKATEKGTINVCSAITEAPPKPPAQPAPKAESTKHEPKSSEPVSLKAQTSNGSESSQNDNPDSKVKAKPDHQQNAQSSVAATAAAAKEPVYLHRVKATYKYLAEDEDELSFEAGEIIQVIAYDDPKDEEEGWLKGIKLGSGEVGLFPANFTKEIQ